MAASEQSYIVTVENGLTHAQFVSLKSHIEETFGVHIQKTINVGKRELLVLQTTHEVSMQIERIEGVMDVEENKKINTSPERKEKPKIAGKKKIRNRDESEKNYIVTVEGGLTNSAQSVSVKSQIQEKYGVRIQKTMTIGKRELLVLQTTPEVSMQIQRIAGVMDVEENKKIRVSPPNELKKQNQFDRKKKMKAAGEKKNGDEQSSGLSLWGLRRITRRGNNSSPADPAADVYTYSGSNDGAGVDIFIMDTGIYINHQDFNGRAGYDFTAGDIDIREDDIDGHGTHVAGTAGGERYGVAKGARLRSVKVLDESGECSYETLVEGLGHIQNCFRDAKSRTGTDKRPKYVVNMSLGVEEKVRLIDRQVKEMADDGVIFVVAAGNEKQDACNCSPGHLAEVITVGAIDQQDELWSESNYGSNYGPCVDILAPGSDILSAGITHPSATALLSGTSMAAPHVAGVIARYIQHMDQPPMPAELKAWLQDTATKDVVKLPSIASSTPNLLLYISCDINPPKPEERGGPSKRKMRPGGSDEQESRPEEGSPPRKKQRLERDGRGGEAQSSRRVTRSQTGTEIRTPTHYSDQDY